MTFPVALTNPAQANAPVVVNENLGAIGHQGVYAKNYASCSGLVWAYHGGRWGGASIADGSHTLNASSTVYQVVNRSTGASSISTSNTNWNDTANYARVFLFTTSGSAVTAVEDHRAGPNGVHGSGSGVSLGAVQLWTKNQTVTPVSLTDGATINVDASLSNNFKVTLGGNRTLANPTNLSDGMTLNFVVKQDGTGSRTLAYGSKYKWPAGTAPVLSTAASAIDCISAQYDSASDVLLCVCQKGFA